MSDKLDNSRSAEPNTRRDDRGAASISDLKRYYSDIKAPEDMAAKVLQRHAGLSESGELRRFSLAPLLRFQNDRWHWLPAGALVLSVAFIWLQQPWSPTLETAGADRDIGDSQAVQTAATEQRYEPSPLSLSMDYKLPTISSLPGIPVAPLASPKKPATALSWSLVHLNQHI